jgi:hypothetical protein
VPEVGELKAVLSATDTGFTGTLNTGADQVEKLGSRVNTSSQHFVNFNVHALESRKVIGTVAAVAGSSAGPLMHFAHAFGAFGPIVGGAIAALFLFREAAEQANRVQDESIALNVRLTNSWKDLTLANMGAQEAIARTKRLELEGLVRPGAEYVSPRTRILQKEEIAELKAYETRLRLNRKFLEQKGFGGSAHGGSGGGIETASRAAEAGAFRAEHTARNPQVAEQQITNAKLDEVKAALLKIGEDIGGKGAAKIAGAY